MGFVGSPRVETVWRPLLRKTPTAGDTIPGRKLRVQGLTPSHSLLFIACPDVGRVHSLRRRHVAQLRHVVAIAHPNTVVSE